MSSGTKEGGRIGGGSVDEDGTDGEESGREGV